MGKSQLLDICPEFPKISNLMLQLYENAAYDLGEFGVYALPLVGPTPNLHQIGIEQLQRIALEESIFLALLETVKTHESVITLSLEVQFTFGLYDLTRMVTIEKDAAGDMQRAALLHQKMGVGTTGPQHLKLTVIGHQSEAPFMPHKATTAVDDSVHVLAVRSVGSYAYVQSVHMSDLANG